MGESKGPSTHSARHLCGNPPIWRRLTGEARRGDHKSRHTDGLSSLFLADSRVPGAVHDDAADEAIAADEVQAALSGADQRFAKAHDQDLINELAEKLRAQLVDAGADAVVGTPADESAARWDLSIVITAASLEAWNALAQGPTMVGMFDELAARAAVVKAWTFQA